jgi:transposase
MAKRQSLVLTDEVRWQLAEQRYRHPHPRVQQRMEVLWLLSQGESLSRAAELAGVSRTTAWRFVRAFRAGGIAQLSEWEWDSPGSELAAHRESLESEFRARPPHTAAEAAARIEALTGVRRGPTQVREFLRHTLGLSWRRVAALPVPPKKVSPSTFKHNATSWTKNSNPA